MTSGGLLLFKNKNDIFDIRNSVSMVARNYLIDKIDYKVIRNLSVFSGDLNDEKFNVLEEAIDVLKTTYISMKSLMNNFIMITEVEFYQNDSLLKKLIVWSSENSDLENQILLDNFDRQLFLPNIFD